MIVCLTGICTLHQYLTWTVVEELLSLPLKFLLPTYNEKVSAHFGVLPDLLPYTRLLPHPCHIAVIGHVEHNPNRCTNSQSLPLTYISQKNILTSKHEHVSSISENLDDTQKHNHTPS